MIEGIIEAALHNFWLKIVSLLLAVLTWFYIVEQLTKGQ